MEYLQIVLLVNTMLLAVVGFFLKNIHYRFEKLEFEVKTAVLNTAVESQRIMAMEKDLHDLKQMVMKQVLKVND